MQKKLFIASIITLVIIGAIFVIIFLVNTDSSPGGRAAETTEYASMEGDYALTADDIKARDELEQFAQTSAIHYFREKNPDTTSIVVSSVEWYFTDHEIDGSDNLLVTANIAALDGSVSTEMIVLEISATTPHAILRTFEPDDRYSTGEVEVRTYDTSERYSSYE